MKPKLLWNGDAVLNTGFARVTHHVLDTLRATWDVSVLGINYSGDPHPYPYPIYPARVYGQGDAWGLDRLADLLSVVRPAVLVVQNDPWNVKEYVAEFSRAVPIVAYMPVDGKNVQGHVLNGLALAIFYTQFALDEARLGGYTGPGAVVPLGVDLAMYAPGDRADARMQLGFGRNGVPDGAFVIGNVNRNQPRKRLDLTIAYFAEWVTEHKVEDAYLYLHLAPTGDRGYDVEQLLRYYGVPANRLIVSSRRPRLGVGVSERALAMIYRAFDVQLTTTQGEGFGLTTAEGMACGIPQIVPDWSALGDWCEDAVLKIPCTSTAATPDNVNIIGGVPDRDATIAALDRLYRDPDARADLSARGLALVQRDCYRWPSIGAAFADVLDQHFTKLRADAPVLEPVG